MTRQERDRQASDSGSRPPFKGHVETELEFHVEMGVRDLEARGWDREAARAEVLRHFGDLGRLHRTCVTLGKQHARRRTLVSVAADVRRDVSYALRQLRAAPGFALAAVLTLSLGLGGTTAIFSVVEAVLLRPFPFTAPERVVTVAESWSGQASDVSAGNYVDWQAMIGSFAAMTAMQWSNFNLSEGDAPERVLGLKATHEYFEVFGVRPLLGRGFTAAEDAPGRDRVVVLSEELWASRFESDSSIGGRQIRINQEPYVVIGVMPAGFDPFDGNERLWVPIAFTPERRQMHDEHYLTVTARLNAEVTTEQAQSALDGIGRVLRERYPRENAERGVRVIAFVDSVVSRDLRSRLWILLGAVGLVLLIACGNVANLLLARGSSRGQELGVRAALGAGRSRLARQLLTESAVLALISALAGAAVAWVGVRLLIGAAPPGVRRLATATLNAPALVFTLALALITTMVFGLAPALRLARGDASGALKEGGRGAVAGTKDRLRGAFIAAEVALAFSLLAGASLLIRTSILLGWEDPGFDAAGVVSACLTLPPAAYGDGETARRTFAALAVRLAATPGIMASGLTSQVPGGPGGGSNGLIPEGRPALSENSIDARLRIVTPGYLDALGIAITRGRPFTDRDVAGVTRVMVVNERFASIAWPDDDPIGRRVLCCEGSETDPMWKTVVGVARDVKWRGPGQDITSEFYLPLAQAPAVSFSWIQNTLTLAVRPRAGGVEGAAAAMRSAVADIAPGIPLFDVRTLEERLWRTYATSRFNAQLLGVLGAVGLLLAVIGIYGVVSYYANRHTHEIGLRMALGASARDIAALVTTQGIRPVIIGLAAGLAGAFVTTRLLTSALFGVAPTDPATFAGVTAVLLAAALVAAVLPARRAMRLDPGRVLTRG